MPDEHLDNLEGSVPRIVLKQGVLANQDESCQMAGKTSRRRHHDRGRSPGCCRFDSRGQARRAFPAVLADSVSCI